MVTVIIWIVGAYLIVWAAYALAVLLKVFGSTILLVVLLILAGAVVFGQEVPEAVVSWDIQFFQAGVNPDTGTPIQTSNFLKSASSCNQPDNPPFTATVVNPARIVLDDPDNLGRDCVLANSSGVLMSVPLGSGLFAVAKARGVSLVSTRSAASNPFNRAIVPIAPAVPAGLKVIQ